MISWVPYGFVGAIVGVVTFLILGNMFRSVLAGGTVPASVLMIFGFLNPHIIFQPDGWIDIIYVGFLLFTVSAFWAFGAVIFVCYLKK